MRVIGLFFTLSAYITLCTCSLSSFRARELGIKTLTAPQLSIGREIAHYIKSYSICPVTEITEVLSSLESINNESLDDKSIQAVLKRLPDRYCQYLPAINAQRKLEGIEGVKLDTGLTIGKMLPWQRRRGYLNMKSSPLLSDQHSGIRRKLSYVRAKRWALLTMNSLGCYFINPLLSRKLKSLKQPIVAVGMLPLVFNCLYPLLSSNVVTDSVYRNDHSSIQIGDKLLSINDISVDHRPPWWIMRLLNTMAVNTNITVCVERLIDGHSRHYEHCSIQRQYLIESSISDNCLLLDNTRVGSILRMTNSSSMLSPPQSSIGYVKIDSFTNQTVEDFQMTLSHLRQQAQCSNSSIGSLVINLCGNTGGLVSSALDMAAMFLTRGSTLCQMRSSYCETLESFRSENDSPDLTTNLLLMVNGQTASASEIFAVALQENGRCRCVGAPSFGKNFAQAVITLSNGALLILSVREYLSPSGRSLANGIVPDILDQKDQSVENFLGRRLIQGLFKFIFNLQLESLGHSAIPQVVVAYTYTCV